MDDSGYYGSCGNWCSLVLDWFDWYCYLGKLRKV